MATNLHEELSNDFDGSSVEEIKFEKNGVTSIVTVYFDKSGVATGVSIDSQYTPSPEEENLNHLKLLKRQLQDAISIEDYEWAAIVKTEIDSLTNQH